MNVYNNGTQEITLADKFKKKLDELACYSESEQKQKILETNGLMKKMDKEEFRSVFTKELFDKINKMIEEEKLSMENACLLLKCIGFYNELKNIWIYGFKYSKLNKRFEKMIIEEDEKKEGKDEKLLFDLCECYMTLCSGYVPNEFILICVPCLLKVALRKEESKEAQKEVEMALFALSCIHELNELGEELYLKEIKEIIEYHQEHQNLTRLAYQFAWRFLINRLFKNEHSKNAIVNELQFPRAETRELDELMKCVDWKKKEEEASGKEMKDIRTVIGLLNTICRFFSEYELQDEKCVILIECLARLCRSARENHKKLVILSLDIFEMIVNKHQIFIALYCLVKGGAINFALEEIQQPTLDTELADKCYAFLKNICGKLREKKTCHIDKAMKNELKRNFVEKLEEEGFRDIVITFFHFLPYIKV